MTQMTELSERLKANSILIACIVIVVALVAVNVVFYMGWQSAKGEQSDLEKAQTAAQRDLNLAIDKFDTVKLQSDLDALSGTPNFPAGADVTDVELSAFLAATAESRGVSITKVTPITGKSETIGGKQYPKRGFAVEVTGTAAKINTFLESLENGSFNTLRLENLSFSSTTGNKFDMVVITR